MSGTSGGLPEFCGKLYDLKRILPYSFVQKTECHPPHTHNVSDMQCHFSLCMLAVALHSTHTPLHTGTILPGNHSTLLIPTSKWLLEISWNCS